tara:strand:- start:675 stop:929 length:255 start_codon:yes stop_codon:yes gene_type:complete
VRRERICHNDGRGVTSQLCKVAKGAQRVHNATRNHHRERRRRDPEVLAYAPRVGVLHSDSSLGAAQPSLQRRFHLHPNLHDDAR